MSGEHPFDPKEIGESKTVEPDNIPIRGDDGKWYNGVLEGFDTQTGDAIFDYGLGRKKRISRADLDKFRELKKGGQEK